MSLEPITNERWGFESNCFVCEPSNPLGLQLPFFLDRERMVVVAEFSLGDAHSGAPSYLHGGVVLAVLDEAMAWATIAIGEQWAVTAQVSAEFVRPVMVGEQYRVEAELREVAGTKLDTVGRVLDGEGNVCTTATATFVALGPAQAAEATGKPVGSENERFTAD